MNLSTTDSVSPSSPQILNIHCICRWQSYLDFILNVFELRSLKSFKGKVLYVQEKKEVAMN